MSLADQSLCTVELATSWARAIARVLQRVRPAGGRVAEAMICALVRSANHGLRPLWGNAASPAKSSLRNRLSHSLTMRRRTPTRVAVAS